MATKTAKKSKANTFTYTYDGKTISLPKFGEFPFGVIRKIRKLTDEEQFYSLLELVTKNDPDTLDVIDEMYADDIVALVEAWQEDAGVSLGESVESADS